MTFLDFLRGALLSIANIKFQVKPSRADSLRRYALPDALHPVPVRDPERHPDVPPPSSGTKFETTEAVGGVFYLYWSNQANFLK